MSVATWKTELALKFTSLTSAQNVSLLDAVNDSETHWNTNHRIAWLVGIGVLAYTFVVLNEFIFGVKAPKVGRRSFWEPRWLVGLRFARNSAPMVLEGYHKVSISRLLFVSGGMNRQSAQLRLTEQRIVQRPHVQSDAQRLGHPCPPAKVCRGASRYARGQN